MSDLFEPFKRIIPELKEEGNRLMKQGAAELANALFNGNAYVPYGQGQYPAHSLNGMENGEKEKESLEQQQQNEGREV